MRVYHDFFWYPDPDQRIRNTALISISLSNISKSIGGEKSQIYTIHTYPLDYNYTLTLSNRRLQPFVLVVSTA